VEGKHMNTQSITITLSEDEALSVRLALNLTACEWADKAMAHDAAGERDDYDTCQRLRAKYHALWERVHDAQRAAEAAELARRERAADDMFASEARETPWPRPFNAITRDIRAQNGLVD
jgi:hypothetical protein